MGRAYTEPKVENTSTGRFRIERVADPDDEFHTRQYLTPGGWAEEDTAASTYAWLDADYEYMSDLLKAYVSGVADAESRAVVLFL